MTKTHTKTTHIKKDENGVKEVIEVSTSGDNAYDRAKILVSNMMEDIDHDAVSDVEARIVAVHADDPPAAGTDGDGRRKKGQHLTEDDRRLRDITPGTNAHEVLSVVARNAEEHDGMLAREVRDRVSGMPPTGASPALTRLYESKLIDREPEGQPGSGGKRYRYWATSHGLTWLREHGHYQPDD